MTRYLLLVTLFLFTALSIFSQNYKEVKLYMNDVSDIRTLINAGMEFDHFVFEKDNSIRTFISDNDFAILQSTGFTYEILIDDWYRYYENLPKLSDAQKNSELQKIEQDFGITGFNYGSMGGFYTLAEVNAELDEMYTDYPNLITQKVSIGNSIEGKPIYIVKISDNPTVNENEPQVLYTALHHAREPESMEQMIFFMFYLLENYGTDPEVTYLVNNREIYFIPVVNPDGYEYNKTTYPSGGGMWRKNRRNNGGSYGVDLNRNYGPQSYWNSPYGGSSTSPSSDTYRGTAPFSEPETAAIRDFLATKNFSNILNYHTYGNYLIYPYGCFPYLTPDSLTFIEFASDITAYNGYSAGTALETVGYSVRGTSDDYAYDGDVANTNGNIFAMTPEVGTTGFWPSQSEIIPLALENLQPNLYFAWIAGESIHLDNPNFSQQYFNPGDMVNMFPSFRNKGLSTGYNIGITVNSLSGYATINSGNGYLDSIQARSSSQVSSPMTITISQSAPVEEEIQLEFVINLNSTMVRKDTFSIIVGTPIIIFEDSTNDPAILWTITATPTTPKWESTNTSYHSAPSSFTESKTGNYANNATVTMTLTSPIDLSMYQHPRLSFWTRYNIESNWDYGQVKISTNNGSTWNPLTGNYTEPGVGSFQPNGQPLYDGIQTSWVQEEIDLTGRNALQNKFQFQLRTDGNTVADGWYVDDIIVYVYGIVPVELSSFNASVFNTEVVLNWSTSSELNNMGFEIERKSLTNNYGWQTIGFIEGSGTVTSTKNYSFIDTNPVKGTLLYRLKQIDFDGSFKIYTTESVKFDGVIDYALEQNFPNPFNPSTVINYSIPVDGNVELTVYNILGSEVAVLVDEFKEAGNHSVKFSSEDLRNSIGSGVYIYKLKSGSFTQTRKMVVLK